MLQNLVIAVGPPVMPWSCELPRASYRIGQPLRHSAALVSESLIWTRVNCNNEFVDRVFVQERRNELSAAHHPDVLAWLIADALGERSNRLRDEFDTYRHRCRRWLAREHV